MSRRTEEAYVHWMRRFILFHNKRHSLEMAEAEVNAFLTHLAIKEHVAAATQRTMNNTSNQKELFPIRGYGSEFHTGRTCAGEQLLMGLLCPYIVGYFFSQDGSLIKKERREWLAPAPRMGGAGPYQIYDPVFEAALSKQISQWQDELGFSPELIRVQKFFDQEMYVGIEQIPEHLQDLDESDEDFEELQASLQEWEASGNFVFYCAKDYFMASDGEVEST